MQTRQLAESADGRRTIAIVMSHGDQFNDLMIQVAVEEQITAASFTAIGAFERFTLGYFEWETKTYKDLDFDQQVEVASLVGNLSRQPDGTPKLHAHCVVATSDGQALGGHVRSAVVRPTLELLLEETPAHLTRRHDDESGLALIDLSAGR